MTRRVGLWLLLALFVAIWLTGLATRHLIGPDEGRYAEISREMALTGDWLTPRLNGLKYFEKPPLQYWTTAAVFQLVGPSEWGARLWTGLTGLLGVLLAGFTARRLFGPQAGIAALMALGSNLLWVLMGHINSLDMGLAFFLELALCGFLLAQQDGTPEPTRRRWMWLVWAALALAMLSKGLVALVLAGATLVAYSLWTRDFGLWKRLELLRGVCLFLLIAAPWFLAVSAANPEFARFFFIHEHFERFLTKAHHRYQPAWYFVPILLLGLLPWTSLALQAWASCWRREPGQRFRPALFLGLWSFVVFAFFSASSSKLTAYILPMFPSVALLVGAWVQSQSRPRLGWHLSAVAVAGVITLLIGFQVRISGHEDPGLNPLYAKYALWILAAGALLLVTTALAWSQSRRGHMDGALIALATGGFLASMAVLQGHDTLSTANSAYHMVERIRPYLKDGMPIYSVHTYDQTLPFYLNRTVTLVSYRDEFTFGQTQEPGLALTSFDELKPLWFAGPPALALMKRHTFLQLQAQGWPFEILAEDAADQLIVRNRSTP